MADYPLTHALLSELCGLDETDARLPLDVLLNLHRARLRVPLTAVAHMVDSLPLSWGSQLTQRYPAVRPDELFKGNEALEFSLVAYYDVQAVMGEPRFNDATISGLVREADESWSVYYPAVFLYRLGEGGASRVPILTSFEIMLRAHPAVGAMLLDLANNPEALLEAGAPVAEVSR